MLEWVCPSCDRLVDPGLDACPFCARRQPDSPPVLAGPSRYFSWQMADRVFRIALGTVAVLSLVYFLAVVWAVSRNDDLLIDRLTRWLPMP